MSRPAQPRWLLVAAFAAIYLIWGSTYLAIAFAIESMPPFVMAGTRFLVAGGVLYAWTRLHGAPRPSRRHWAWALLLGALFFLIGNGSVVWVEQRLPSGLTALIVAMVSVWTALIEWVKPGGARPSGVVLTGVALGFAGVALLVLPGGSSGRADPAGVGLLMFSTFAWAAASVISRDAHLPENTLLVSAMEMLAGGAWLTLASLVTREWAGFDVAAITVKSWLSFAYLAVFGSLVTFTAFAWLLKVTSPSKVATAGYINPMIAVLLGWLLGGEQLSLRTLLASLVIVASVVLIVTGRVALRRPAPVEAKPAPSGSGVAPLLPGRD
jgi:drug/metabolite transporter (DMT)-like permease